MRGAGPLLLLALLAGCLAPPAEEAPSGAWQGAAPVAAAPAVDERLRVAVTPEAPEPGDVVRIEIDAPLRWPAPRCLMSDVMARDPSLLGQSGGSGESVPASEMDGRYVCEHVVAEGAGAVLVSVTRPEIDRQRTRIWGPHVVDVAGPLRLQQRASFVSFTLDEADGLPFARAQLPAVLASASVPGPAPLHAWNTTYAWISLEVIPIGDTLHMSDYAYPEWPTPREMRALIDVPERIRAAERDMDGSYPHEGYLLASVAHAANDLAFAVSEPEVRGYGTCADGSCFIRDG